MEIRGVHFLNKKKKSSLTACVKDLPRSQKVYPGHGSIQILCKRYDKAAMYIAHANKVVYAYILAAVYLDVDIIIIIELVVHKIVFGY